jgi:hypothetical protein
MGTRLLNGKPAAKTARRTRLATLAALMAMLDFSFFSSKLVSPKRHAFWDNGGGTMQGISLSS